MDKDINNLEEIINLCKEEINNNDKNITATLDLEDLKSLKNFLDRYKELEEENKQLEAIKDEAIRRYNFESIPKSKVKKLLDKEELPLTIVGGIRNRKTLEYGKKLGRIEICKELLGKE